MVSIRLRRFFTNCRKKGFSGAAKRCNCFSQSCSFSLNNSISPFSLQLLSSVGVELTMMPDWTSLSKISVRECLVSGGSFSISSSIWALRCCRSPCDVSHLTLPILCGGSIGGCALTVSSFLLFCFGKQIFFFYWQILLLNKYPVRKWKKNSIWLHYLFYCIVNLLKYLFDEIIFQRAKQMVKFEMLQILWSNNCISI